MRNSERAQGGYHAGQLVTVRMSPLPHDTARARVVRVDGLGLLLVRVILPHGSSPLALQWIPPEDVVAVAQ